MVYQIPFFIRSFTEMCVKSILKEMLEYYLQSLGNKLPPGCVQYMHPAAMS